MTFSPNDDDRLWKEPDKDRWFHFASPLRYIVILLIIVCIIVLGWYLLSPARRSFKDSALPLIQADTSPYKTKAEDQGVPNIKHQDKLIYGRIRNDQNTPTVEHILPDPEPPLAHNKDNGSTVKMVERYVPEDIQLEQASSLKSEAPQSSTPKVTSIEDLLEDLPHEKTKSKEENESNPQSEVKPTPEEQAIRKHALIQLGSLKSYDLAESEWKRIAAKHKNILGNPEPIIQKVDLGIDKGIYYRLRVNYDDREQAKKACDNLKERKVDCLVIY